MTLGVVGVVGVFVADAPGTKKKRKKLGGSFRKPQPQNLFVLKNA